MARAGMARWRGSNCTGPPEGGDEVQRSLELLDRVLSEFDDLENGNVGGAGAADSPHGHQSEDDGYMSMNGRRAKLALELVPPPASEVAAPTTAVPVPVPVAVAVAVAETETDAAPAAPPPPEEAERIISTLLPRLSPSSSLGLGRNRKPFLLSTSASQEALLGCRVTTATQTTLPKTRAPQRGWRSVDEPSLRFASLPPDSALQRAARRLPPRTVPGAGLAERHREVRRRTEDNFSDDSLEAEAEAVEPPVATPVRPRSRGIAWEVTLDDAPGSTRVVGRRRRRSADHSSSGSIHALRDRDDWPDPPPSTEDEAASPFSDSYNDSSTTNDPEEIYLPKGKELVPNGTYVIRKGRKKERRPLPPEPGDLKRCSSTFDNIRTLLREGRLEGLDDPPPDFPPPPPPGLVRVVSLPSLPVEMAPLERSRSDGHRLSRLHELAVTVEEDEDAPQEDKRRSLSLDDEPLPSSLSPKDEGSFKEEDEAVNHEVAQEVVAEVTNLSLDEDPPVVEDRLNGPSSSCEALDGDAEAKEDEEDLIRQLREEAEPRPPERLSSRAVISHASDPWLHASEISEVRVVPVLDAVSIEVQHEFPPLPPSPVEEDDDEYSEILPPAPPCKADTLPQAPPPPPSASLRTRSMDAGFSRGNRSYGSRKDIPAERRTLPPELPGPPRRRTFQQRREAVLQTSCSLPETPIFARGCDIPRTPHRRAPDLPPGAVAGARTTPRLAGALAGAELLRLAGGPGRGWYPRHRQQRPASIEHLDRLAPASAAPGWDAASRKPLTLPPNLSPKFFHRSPREALRRVTSLLIRKGSSSKESKKDPLSPTGFGESSAEPGRHKRGFFRSLWKRSRHYSLEQQ